MVSAGGVFQTAGLGIPATSTLAMLTRGDFAPGSRQQWTVTRSFGGFSLSNRRRRLERVWRNEGRKGNLRPGNVRSPSKHVADQVARSSSVFRWNSARSCCWIPVDGGSGRGWNVVVWHSSCYAHFPGKRWLNRPGSGILFGCSERFSELK